MVTLTKSAALWNRIRKYTIKISKELNNEHSKSVGHGVPISAATCNVIGV